jgi:LysR family transcriptional regulator, transcriptional activator for dmlA
MLKNLNDVYTFVLAAKSGSLSAAASELDQPVSTVSRAISRMEKDLGVVLVRRGARGLTLTDEGEAYLPICKRALRTLREGELNLRVHRARPSGVLRIACPVTFARDMFMPLLPGFLERYPEIRFAVEPYAANWDQEPRDGVDIFFKVRAPRDSQRHVRTYPGAVRALFATKTYLEKAGTPAHPDDLRQHSCTGSGTFRLTRNMESVSPPIHFLVDASDPYVHLRFVQQDLGIAALPVYMSKWAENRGSFVRVLPQWQPDPIVLCALFNGLSRLTPKVHVFLEYLEEFIGTNRDPRLRKERFSEGLFTERALPHTYSP